MGEKPVDSRYRGAGRVRSHRASGASFRARYADPFILPLVVALNGIGLAMIFRIDKDPAMQKAPVGESQLFWTASQ